MGADMLVAVAVLEAGEEPDFDAARRYIDKLSEERLCEAAGEEVVEDVPYVGGRSLPEVRAALHEALAVFERAVTGYHREITELWPRNGDVIYLTGGLSWGDAPTELYEQIEKLTYSGVLGAAGFSS